MSDFPPTGPFADLTPPNEVSVTRGAGRTDAGSRGAHTGEPGGWHAARYRRAPRPGTVVLFHAAPEATWSNLPISGSFVEMLRRIVRLSRNQGSIAANADAGGATLPPYRMIAANGQMVPPTPDARPIAAGGGVKPVTLENPPGLYGGEDGLLAHNLLAQDAVFAPIVRPQFSAPVTDMRYALNRSRDLRGPLLIAALALMMLDVSCVLDGRPVCAPSAQNRAGSHGNDDFGRAHRRRDAVGRIARLRAGPEAR